MATKEATGTDGDGLSWQTIISAEEQLESANADVDQLSWLINPKTKKRASDILIKSTSGAQLIYDRDTMRLAGRRTAVSNIMPSNREKGSSGAVLSDLLLTDASRITVVMWGAPVLSLSTEASDAFEKDQTFFRIKLYANCALEYPGSHHLRIKDIKTTA